MSGPNRSIEKLTKYRILRWIQLNEVEPCKMFNYQSACNRKMIIKRNGMTIVTLFQRTVKQSLMKVSTLQLSKLAPSIVVSMVSLWFLFMKYKYNFSSFFFLDVILDVAVEWNLFFFDFRERKNVSVGWNTKGYSWPSNNLQRRLSSTAKKW